MALYFFGGIGFFKEGGQVAVAGVSMLNSSTLDTGCALSYSCTCLCCETF